MSGWIVVGRRKDRRVVCWVNVIKLALLLWMIMAAGMLVVYWLLSGGWSPTLPGVAIILAGAFVGGAIGRGLQTSMDELQDVA